MPRGRRPRKVGQRRIDAALDALRPLGFTDRRIIRTVHRLLKVYGGESGWVFLEEGSYRLLIDTLIEEQEKDDSHDDRAGELKFSDTLTSGTTSRDSEACPTSETLMSGMTDNVSEECPTSEDSMSNSQSTDNNDFDRENTHLEHKHSAINGSSPRAQGEGVSWKDISCLSYAKSSETIQRCSETEEAPRSLQVGGSGDPVKRKPCFGWLEEDDYEVIQRKRVSRWDIKPATM